MLGKDIFTQEIKYEINHNKDIKKEVYDMVADVVAELGKDKRYILKELAYRLEQIFDDYRETEQGNLNTICSNVFDNFLVNGLERVNWEKIAKQLKIK
jgi:hypothetical protein